MKQNTSFRPLSGRIGQVKAFILGAAFHYSSLPRLILEVFLRKDFGRRYFSVTAAIFAAIILLYIPFRYSIIVMNNASDFWNFLWHYLTWYIFVGFYIWKCIKHYRVVKEETKELIYGKHTQYSGTLNPLFLQIKISKQVVTERQIECFLEPAVFFIVGLVLAILGQYIGILFLVCSVIYSLSYHCLYFAADQEILDVMDDMIFKEYREKMIVEGLSPLEAMGLEIKGEMPTSKATRQQMFDHAVKDEAVDLR